MSVSPSNEPSARSLSDFARERGGRVTLGHDWLTGMRGGERVLEIMCREFPDAPIATMLCNPNSVSGEIMSHRIVASFLNRVPGIAKTYRNFLPLMPMAARGIKVPDCDLLVTTSHCVAKSFRKPKGAFHLCCCFTPMRYAWLFQHEYLGSAAKRLAAAPMLAALRAWDKKMSVEVDQFVAISKTVAERIRKFYGRDSLIAYPPVDAERCCPRADGAGGNGGFDLIVSALVPYKRVDLAVETYTKNGWPLKVVGVGSEAPKLAKMAGPTVELLGRLPDERVVELYRDCRMLLFPGEEDFGIVPLEAQACGRPVVAYGKGGALETIVDGKTGVFFGEQTADALSAAVEAAASTEWDSAAIRAHAVAFSPAAFLSAMVPA